MSLEAMYGLYLLPRVLIWTLVISCILSFVGLTCIVIWVAVEKFIKFVRNCLFKIKRGLKWELKTKRN